MSTPPASRHRWRRRLPRWPAGEHGFTVSEFLIAITLLSVGLLGISSVVIQSGGLLAGTMSGHEAVVHGYYMTSATNLAQARLEQIRRLSYVMGPPPVDQIGAPIPAGFADEPYDTIPGHGNFTRRVRVENATPAPNIKTVTVTVDFRITGSGGTRVESISLGTLIAARP